MSNFFELKSRFSVTQQQMIELQNEYNKPGKVKGEAFRKRYTQLINKMQAISNQAKNYGKTGSIIKVTGLRKRVNKKNPNLKVDEKVEFYLVNIDPKEIHEILSFQVKNLSKYNVEVIKPGEIIVK